MDIPRPSRGIANILRDSFQLDAVEIVERQTQGSPFSYELLVNEIQIFSFDYGTDGWLCSSTWVQAFLSSLSQHSQSADLQPFYFLEGALLWWAHSETQSSGVSALQDEINSAFTLVVGKWIEEFQLARSNDDREAFALEALLLTWLEISESYGFRDSEVLAPIRNELEMRKDIPPVADSFWPSIEEFEYDPNAPALPVLTDDGMAVSRAQNLEAWIQARRMGITATDARRLVRKNGKLSKQRLALLKQKLDDSYESYSSERMQYGIHREGPIARWVALNFPGAEANDVLFERNSGHLATPDMIHPDFVVEIKSSINTAERVGITYLDQLQWQMYVMGRPRALLVVEHPETEEIETLWVESDQYRIARLKEVADCLLEVLDRARFEGRPAELLLEESDRENSSELSPPSTRGLMSRLKGALGGENPVVPERNSTIESRETDSSDETQLIQIERVKNEGISASAGNPIREIRELCRTSQAQFLAQFGFSKATIVSLEAGMFASVSARQEDAILQLARDNYFDLTAYLLAEHESADLNSAYQRWQRRARKINFDTYLADERPPFPFSRAQSPLETLMLETTGSIDAFCKAFKIQRISISRYLGGETQSMPKQLRAALADAGFQYLEELDESQSEWSSRFFS